MHQSSYHFELIIKKCNILIHEVNISPNSTLRFYRHHIGLTHPRQQHCFALLVGLSAKNFFFVWNLNFQLKYLAQLLQEKLNILWGSHRNEHHSQITMLYKYMNTSTLMELMLQVFFCRLDVPYSLMPLGEEFVWVLSINTKTAQHIKT